MKLFTAIYLLLHFENAQGAVEITEESLYQAANYLYYGYHDYCAELSSNIDTDFFTLIAWWIDTEVVDAYTDEKDVAPDEDGYFGYRVLHGKSQDSVFRNAQQTIPELPIKIFGVAWQNQKQTKCSDMVTVYLEMTDKNLSRTYFYSNEPVTGAPPVIDDTHESPFTREER